MSASEVKPLDFSNAWPYNLIETQIVDGQEMVYIPKIYVNNTQVKSGPYTGKYQYSIAPMKINNDWHIHPAFMYKGKEMSGIQIGAYIASKDNDGKAASVKNGTAWTGVTHDKAHDYAMNRNVTTGTDEQQGWHMYSIYEHHLIARLMLIEHGTTDLQKILPTPEWLKHMYRGIHQLFDSPYWLDGFDGQGQYNGTLRIFKNDGSQEYIDTKIKTGRGGWVIDTFRNQGDGYDLGDVFLAEKMISDTDKKSYRHEGSFGDSQNLTGMSVYRTGERNDNYNGPFAIREDTAQTSNSKIGFRLSRYVE